MDQPTDSALLWIPLLPLVGALINLLFGRKLPREAVHFIAVAVVASSFGVVVSMMFGITWMYLSGIFVLAGLVNLLVSHDRGRAGMLLIVGVVAAAAVAVIAYLLHWSAWSPGPLWSQFRGHAEGAPVEVTKDAWTWITVGDFKIDLAFRFDTLSAVMCLIITGVGTLIHIYSTGYMADEPRYAAYFGYLNLFTGAMLILVLGKSMPILFIGWEGVGVCSYLLIGFWFTNEAFATAGRKAFVVNRIGDFAFLLGMFLMYWATRSLDFGDYRHLSDASLAHLHQATWGGERMAMIACVLLFIGACGKSAQIPLYVWLPDAMAGPTPVSALIHAATMVTAGVYMVARMSFVFQESTTAMLVVATIGMLTALAAAFMAFAQTDLKKVLAYSTVSQLGFMFVAVGTGNSVGGIFHVGTHAFFKAGLFLGAGSVMHAMSGSGDITKMGGLAKKLPITHWCFLIYCLAISGFPGLAGWFSKDDILSQTYASLHEGWPTWYRYFLWAGLSLAALGTAVYMWRLYFLVFSGDCRADATTQQHIHESPATMTVPLVILAALTIAGGFINMPHVFPLVPDKYKEMLGQWLNPSVARIDTGALNDSRVWMLLGIATTVGLVGIAIAWFLYGRGDTSTVDKLVASETGQPIYQASLHKLWVDEAYDAAIVRPFRFIAGGLYEVVDRWIIDTALVEGLARVVGLFGRLARWIQNGQVQRYMVGLILGAALIFFLSSRASHPEITWHKVPAGLELDAYTGAGLEGHASKLRWDLQGDGEWDLKPDAKVTGTPKPEDYLSDPQLVRPAGVVGPFVRLEITDPATGNARVITAHIPAGGVE